MCALYGVFDVTKVVHKSSLTLACSTQDQDFKVKLFDVIGIFKNLRYNLISAIFVWITCLKTFSDLALSNVFKQHRFETIFTIVQIFVFKIAVRTVAWHLLGCLHILV